MAYTPPTSPVTLDFVTSGYSAPVSPVTLDFVDTNAPAQLEISVIGQIPLALRPGRLEITFTGLVPSFSAVPAQLDITLTGLQAVFSLQPTQLSIIVAGQTATQENKPGRLNIIVTGQTSSAYYSPGQLDISLTGGTAIFAMSPGQLDIVLAGGDAIFYVPPVIVNNTITTLFSLSGQIKNSIKTTFSLTTTVKNSIASPFDLQNFNLAQRTVQTVFDLTQPVVSELLSLDAELTLNGQLVDINSANLSQDEDSWNWAFNASISDHGNWSTVQPSNGNYPEITLTVRGVVFNLMIEGMQRSRRDVNNTWAINGRGITARLDGKYAVGVDTSWRNINAQAIIQELCAAAAITLDYQDVDWQIKELEGQGRYPIEIINEIASAIGAVVQTSPDGTLIIRPRYAIKPTSYLETALDFSISDVDDYETLDEQWIDRDNYNLISVGDSDTDASNNQHLSITAEDDLNSDGEKISAKKILKIYSVPFISDIILDDSAGAALSLIYQGIVTEQIDEEAVEIVKGSGSLSKKYYGTVSTEYIHDNLGAITITEDGEVTTETAEQSLIKISYNTKYHKYLANRTTSDKYLQVFAEVEA